MPQMNEVLNQSSAEAKKFIGLVRRVLLVAVWLFGHRRCRFFADSHLWLGALCCLPRPCWQSQEATPTWRLFGSNSSDSAHLGAFSFLHISSYFIVCLDLLHLLPTLWPFDSTCQVYSLKTRPVRPFDPRNHLSSCAVMENIGEPLYCEAEYSGLSISLIQSRFCGNNEPTLPVY